MVGFEFNKLASGTDKTKTIWRHNGTKLEQNESSLSQKLRVSYKPTLCF
jgi:hypothetical protein